MTNEELVRELVEASYATGYYSGQGEDGQEHHMRAIERRRQLRGEVLRRLNGQEPEEQKGGER